MRNIHHICNNIITYLYLLLPHICSSVYNYYTLLLLTNFRLLLAFITLHIFYTDTLNYDIYEFDIILLALIVLKDGIHINIFNIITLIFLYLYVIKGKLGLGDLKIFIIFGLGLNPLSFCYLLFYSSFTCIIYATIAKINRIPFGPFIMIGYLLL